MAADGLDDAAIAAILTRTRRVALVGASAKPERPSYGVQGFLQRHGYDLVPVNPGLAGQSLQGREVVATLDAAAPLDLVDIFRAPDAVPAIVRDVIRLGANTLWLQLGIVHQEAAAQARAAGIAVVMDRCMTIELRRLGFA